MQNRDHWSRSWNNPGPPKSTITDRGVTARLAGRGGAGRVDNSQFSPYDPPMALPLGYHIVKSCYGLWLPGDDRGSWSDAWDEKIGYFEPHTLHIGDPVRNRMAQERMKHAPVQLTESMIETIARAIGNCVEKSDGGLTIAAATIQQTHMHLLIPYSGRDIENTSKWIADLSTKAVHRETDHDGPVWSKGKWRSFVYQTSYWRHAGEYIRQHNVRAGLAADPYMFIDSSTL